MRPLIVGQAPARGHDGEAAFVGTRAGERLARLCGLDSSEELPEHFDLVNVLDRCVEPFRPSSPVVRDAGRELLDRIVAEERAVVVCCGSAVARALGIARSAGHRLWEWDNYPGWFAWAIVPHPSGRNRYWNDPALVAVAEAWWRELVQR